MIVLFFVLGAVLASFYTCLALRLPNDISIIKGRSYCDNCHTTLKALDLIPIFSYIFLGGKCKNCKDKISCFYPIFEFTSGLLFALSYIIFGLSLNTLLAIVFISMLLIIIISDYQTMIIPDSILIVFGVLILLIKYFIVGYPSIVYSLLDGVIAFIFMLLLKLFGDFIFKKESMGGGDIKLMFIFGVMFGYIISIFSVFVAALIGLPVSLILLKKNKSHEIPFGPFLAVAAIIILFTKIDVDTLINFLIIK